MPCQGIVCLLIKGAGASHYRVPSVSRRATLRERVLVTRAKPIKAIVFAFVIPLVLMLISAVVMNALDVSEDVMVLGLLVLLLLYALVLRGMRGILSVSLGLQRAQEARITYYDKISFYVDYNYFPWHSGCACIATYRSRVVY